MVSKYLMFFVTLHSICNPCVYIFKNGKYKLNSKKVFVEEQTKSKKRIAIIHQKQNTDLIEPGPSKPHLVESENSNPSSSKYGFALPFPEIGIAFERNESPRVSYHATSS